MRRRGGRAEYEQSGGQSKPVRFDVKAVPCPVCGAPRGRRCPGRDAAHDERLKLARKKHANWKKRNARIAAAQRRRWAKVTVRYECPICGGDHLRRDHDRVTNPTDLIGKARQT